MENWRPSCNRITPAVMWMVQLNRWRLTSELGESGELCSVYCCTFIEFIHGIFQQDTHTHAHNGFLVASTVSCNSINNFSSGESPRRCVQSFMQIGEIAWEEFEKVGLWHFTNLEEKKCVCGRWYKSFECVMWCKSRMTIDYEIFLQVWRIFVCWVLGYVQAVKIAIIWDKKVVTTKTIGTSQAKTCSDPNKRSLQLLSAKLSSSYWILLLNV